MSKILESGQTGVMDRYYKCHKKFDHWQEEEKHFTYRIRKGILKGNSLGKKPACSPSA